MKLCLSNFLKFTNWWKILSGVERLPTTKRATTKRELRLYLSCPHDDEIPHLWVSGFKYKIFLGNGFLRYGHVSHTCFVIRNLGKSLDYGLGTDCAISEATGR